MYLPTSCRMLHRGDLVRDFLDRTLDMTAEISDNIVSRIVEAELWLLNNVPTNLVHNEERWALRRIILNELLQQTRLASDEDIKLGEGGALPQSGVRSEGKMFLLIGPPASGKSWIAAQISEDNGAVIVDSDYAKRKLPEFLSAPAGASLVHEESNGIVVGFEGHQEEPNLLFECIINNYNIVLPKIGASTQSIVTIAEKLSKGGYEVHLILVYVSKKIATKRAVERFVRTNRYVPLGLIFDHYANDSLLSYHIMKDQNKEIFKSIGAICTYEEKPECVDATDGSPALYYGKKTLNWKL